MATTWAIPETSYAKYGVVAGQPHEVVEIVGESERTGRKFYVKTSTMRKVYCLEHGCAFGKNWKISSEPVPYDVVT